MTLPAVATEAACKNCRRFTTYSEKKREDDGVARNYTLVSAESLCPGLRRIIQSDPSLRVYVPSSWTYRRLLLPNRVQFGRALNRQTSSIVPRYSSASSANAI